MPLISRSTARCACRNGASTRISLDGTLGGCVRGVLRQSIHSRPDTREPKLFYAPPRGFTSVNPLKPRGGLIIAGQDQLGALEHFIASADKTDRFEARSVAQAQASAPSFWPENWPGRRSSSACPISTLTSCISVLADVQVPGRHQPDGSSRARSERDARGWLVRTASDVVRGRIVVNAAGAWAGEIAKLAGAQDIELQPRRRTACLIDPPPGTRLESWPMVVNFAEEFFISSPTQVCCCYRRAMKH